MDEQDCLCEVVDRPYWPFKIENISAAQAPLLKIYYWESFNIDGLNRKLCSEDEDLDHDICIPTAQINSCPLQIILWIRNTSISSMEIRLKRIQNCACLKYPTRVGFNQYRELYHCPHRHLVNINQELLRTKPDDLVAMSINSYFYLLGEHKLTYELRCDDRLVLRLHFYLDIVCFEPQKCLITKELVPVNMSEPRRFVQALWVRNITMQDLNFTFTSKTRGLKVINQNLTVPRQSVWPLIVEYRPTDFHNELELIQSFDNIRTTHIIRARGYFMNQLVEPSFPLIDYDCSHHRYILYPNKIDFHVEVDEDRSLMVCIHNYNQNCVEFRWQNYVINNLFSVSYEPETFRLRGHHSKLCVVHVRSFDRPLFFKRVPLVLEVHRIFDQSTKIAKELLEEIESIDNPKWKQGSYMEHVLLHMDIEINFKPKPPTDPVITELIMQKTTGSTDVANAKNRSLTIFEKLFWEYLSQSNFMRANINPEITNELSYTEVLQLYKNPPLQKPPLDLSKTTVLKLVNLLIAESIRDISKNWMFVPPDGYERPL